MQPNSISRQQIDQDDALVQEAEARVNAYEKNKEVYKLNREFANVVAPISGMVSRYYLTLGNLVNQDQTLLTTIVSLDPIYAYFDMDEPTLLRIRKAINEGKIRAKRANGLRVPVFMGLQGEAGFPHEGTINFVNNQLNPTTGSILVRGIFPNPKPSGGTRLLSPGMFVRIRLPIGDPHSAILVIDKAISSDQGIKFVYVVDKDHKVQYRRVTTTFLEDDGLRVVTEGLKPDELIVVSGLQQVRPRMTIQPELGPMPSLGRDVAGETATAQPTITQSPATQPTATQSKAEQPASTRVIAKPANASQLSVFAAPTTDQPARPSAPPQDQPKP